MSTFFSQIMKGSKAIWIIYIALCVLSCTVTFSAMSRLALGGSSVSAPYLRHVMFLIMGAAIIMLIQILDFRLIRTLSPFFLLFACGLLGYICVVGGSEDGANRFSSLGQPSEYVKLGLILVMSEVIMQLGSKPQFPTRAFYIVVSILALILLLIMHANLSTAIIISSIMVVMMLAGGMGIWRVGRLVLLALVFVVCIISIAYVVPEQKFNAMAQDFTLLEKIERIYTWRARLDRHFSNEEDASETHVKVTDENRQEVYAKVAVCRGGWMPSGLGSSLQRNYLPEAYSDYVFAIATEEGGFVLGIIIVLLYLSLFMICLYYIIFKEKKIFRKLLLLGCSFSITFQAAIHIAVTVGAMPVTGQTLPLISRGGASILVVSAMFGLIIKITATPSEQTSTYNPETVPDDQLPVSDDNEPITDNQQTTKSPNQPISESETDTRESETVTPEPIIDNHESVIVNIDDDDDDSIIIIED